MTACTFLLKAPGHTLHYCMLEVVLPDVLGLVAVDLGSHNS